MAATTVLIKKQLDTVFDMPAGKAQTIWVLPFRLFPKLANVTAAPDKRDCKQ